MLQGASLLATSNRNWNVYGQKTLLTGGNIRLDWLNNRFTTDSDFQSLSPQYTPQALLSLNQPLLRGFGLYFSRLNIRIAETATDAAIETYRANVANFITQVVTAYWNVVRLTEQLGAEAMHALLTNAGAEKASVMPLVPSRPGDRSVAA